MKDTLKVTEKKPQNVIYSIDTDIKKLKTSIQTESHHYGGYSTIFDEECLEILRNESFDTLSCEKMHHLIEMALSKINQDTAIPIFAFLLELENHQINVTSEQQEPIKASLNQSIRQIKTFLPEKLLHYEFDTLTFRDQQEKNKIPFPEYLSNYLISFLMKCTTQEIKNNVDRYFTKEEPVRTSGIEIIIKNALKASSNSQRFIEDIDRMFNKGRLQKNELSAEEIENLRMKREKVKLCSSNTVFLNILRPDEYNMDLFNLLLKYPERLENFILFLYINSEETYKLFLRNLLDKCNAEEQSKILEHFLEVNIEDLQFFNTENISKMIQKKMNRKILDNKILDLPKEDILELLKYNFSFFIGHFDKFEISSRELLQAAEESTEILEYLFSHADKFGAFIIGSTMRILSGKTAEFTLNFFKKKIYELERAKLKNENGNGDQEASTLETSVCEGILVFLKHNQPSTDLLNVFRSQYLLRNQKYFLSVISILEKSTILSKILQFFTEETYPSFAAVLSPNEILDELCFIEIKHDPEDAQFNRFIQVLDLVLSKMTESGIIQTLMQVEDSTNYLFVLRKTLEKYSDLRSFIITALKRISPRDPEYLDILEDLNNACVDVLLTKNAAFIEFCFNESQKIKFICEDPQNRNVPGFERIEDVLRNMSK
ncbi:hypothetical protein M153_2540008474 [Pseudoloma neurophilia]|uniref:Uncharacterized protein n=1 Tax=Pseudoloma neurophilia TaxID=146866 RepID=A0A0R0M5V9_9MICR|nr:hypothetical protein M153_2540008474 [Pseudoloma neurophilia]